MTEIKIGLFNSAANNSWHLSPYTKCVQAYQLLKLNQTEASNRQMFCDAGLANAVLLIFSLIFTFTAVVILSFILYYATTTTSSTDASWLSNFAKNPRNVVYLKYYLLAVYFFAGNCTF